MDTAGGVSMPGTTTVSGSGTGGAAQPFAEDSNATLTQTAENPPAIIGGTGAAAPEVMESLGGFTIELLPRGAFTNSILAPCYAPCPLATLDVGVDTVENTVLARYKVNPWDENFAGPYIKQWADMHQRFCGSFKLGLHVASAGTILGKIAIYYVPGDCVLPDTPTRQSMVIFQHVIVDLQQPSSEAIIIRNSNRTDFYLDRDNVSNRGQILIMTYTSIANTYGATIMPPIYPTVMLGQDAMFTLPYSSLKPPSGTATSRSIPPVPPAGEDTYLFTDGKNVPLSVPSPASFPLTLKGTKYVADHALTSGVSRTLGTPVSTTSENDLSWRWGAWRKSTTQDWVAAVRTAFGNDKLEGATTRSYPGNHDAGELPSIDTIFTIQPPYDFNIETPVPDAVFYRAFEHTNTLYPAMVSQEARYLVTNIQSADGDVAFASYKESSTSGATLDIKPILNIDEGTFYHTILDVPPTRTNTSGTVDRFKITVEDVSMSVPAEQEGNTPGGKLMHNRNFKSFTADRSCVCKESFPANGGAIPPGYKLVQWYEKDDLDCFPFGISGVLEGIKGPTHCPTKNWMEFWNSAVKYLDDNKLASYELKGVTANGQTVIYLLFNHSGIWVFKVPDYSLCVSNRSAFSWYLQAVHSENEWPILTQSSPMAFQSRLVGAKSGGDMAQSIAMGAMGGLMSGLGNSLDNFQNHLWDVQMQKKQFANQNLMQDKALRNARELTMMNNRTAIGNQIQSGKNAVAAVNARVAGTNPVRNSAANAAPVNIPDGTQAVRAAASAGGSSKNTT